MERAKPVPPEEWQKRVERWRDSGLSAKEFSAELGINHHSLTTWATRLRQGYDRSVEAEQARARRAKRKRKPATAELRLVEVTPAAAPSSRAAFELVIQGRTLRVPPDFDADSLQRLVRVLESVA